MEAQLQTAFVGGTVPIAHPTSPDATGGPELPDLFEEIAVAVEEEAETGGEVVDVQAGSQRGLHVSEPIGQSEGKFLGGRRAGLPDVVAGNRHRIPARHFGGCKADDVGDQTYRWPGRKDVLLLGLVLLEDVILEGAGKAPPLDPSLLSDGHVHGQQDRGGPVNGHRRRDGPQVDAGEQVGHVLHSVDGHPGPTDLAEGPVMVRVAAHERRHVERRGKARAPSGQ